LLQGQAMLAGTIPLAIPGAGGAASETVARSSDSLTRALSKRLLPAFVGAMAGIFPFRHKALATDGANEGTNDTPLGAAFALIARIANITVRVETARIDGPSALIAPSRIIGDVAALWAGL